ncbi:hypothetical protein [Cryptosporangium japonicum]|uniref:Uncharacterized protein n=1 Tax=Cryptosporangium japonicum TaxID=80872 RepID=A0ABP3E3B5_9ACTN
MTIPSDVLDAAAADPASPAWTRIWRDSFRSGSSDPDSAALLPWLARTCAAFSPEQRETAVIQAGRIALDATDEDRAAYASDIEVLRALAVEGLPSASTDRMFVYLQQALLAYDGDELWGKELDRLNDAEADVVCPECDDDLLVDLDSDDGSITPGLSSPLGARLHAQAVRAGRKSVATRLTFLFGQLTCPSCGSSFPPADHLAGT